MNNVLDPLLQTISNTLSSVFQGNVEVHTSTFNQQHVPNTVPVPAPAPAPSASSVELSFLILVMNSDILDELLDESTTQNQSRGNESQSSGTTPSAPSASATAAAPAAPAVPAAPSMGQNVMVFYYVRCSLGFHQFLFSAFDDRWC